MNISTSPKISIKSPSLSSSNAQSLISEKRKELPVDLPPPYEEDVVSTKSDVLGRHYLGLGAKVQELPVVLPISQPVNPKYGIATQLSEASKEELSNVVKHRNTIMNEKKVELGGVEAPLESRIQSHVFRVQGSNQTEETKEWIQTLNIHQGNKEVLGHALTAFYKQAHPLENEITLYRGITLDKDFPIDCLDKTFQEKVPVSYSYDKQFCIDWIKQGDDSGQTKQRVILKTTFKPGTKVLPTANPLFDEKKQNLEDPPKGFNQDQKEVCVQPCSYQFSDPDCKYQTFSEKLDLGDGQNKSINIVELNLKACPTDEKILYKQNFPLRPRGYQEED